MEYMQKSFPLFAPSSVTDNNVKYFKKPKIKGWLNVTSEQSAELAKHPEYRDGHFMFLTGKANNIIVFDIDVHNPSRPDHLGKVDGLKKWDELFPDLDYTNSLIVLTPSGGRHLYCEYDDTITNRDIAKDVLIDILSDGNAVTFGPKYTILQSPPGKLSPVHQEVKMYLTMNINSNNVTNNFASPKVLLREAALPKVSLRAAELSELWDIQETENNCFKLVAKSGACCVNSAYEHSEPKHSCMYVRRMSVVANCFRHGNRIISGDESRYLREFSLTFLAVRELLQIHLKMCYLKLNLRTCFDIKAKCSKG